MKHYIKESIIFALQLFMFYISPLFAGETDAMGMVLLIVLATLSLSFLLGIVSNNKVKYLYPIVTAIAFIPSIFLFYNESASIHSVWYLIISSAGLAVGSLIHILICKLLRKKQSKSFSAK